MRSYLCWRDMRCLGAVSAALLATLWLAGAGAAAAQKATPGPQILMEHQKYAPAQLIVPVGTTVTWINRDADPHTVTASSGEFRSPGLDTDESFSRRFTVPGTYAYFCTLHPLMTGTITVK
jgi:plastocyanin